MKLCDDGHDAVAYDSTDCPACELIKERDQKDKEIDKLDDELAKAYKDIEDKDEELESLRSAAGILETIQPRRPRLTEGTAR